MAHNLTRILRGTVGRLLRQQPKTIVAVPVMKSVSSSRNYIAEMRREAFEGNILRLLRNEIQYELDRAPPAKLTPEFNSFLIDDCPGEQWIRLKKKFGENEEIKIDVTMFDGSFPIKNPGDVATGDDVQNHISMIINILKGKGSDILEIVCSAWPDTVEIRKVFTRTCDKFKDQLYTGPEFKELDDKLQDALYDFLEARGITDDLAAFCIDT